MSPLVVHRDGNTIVALFPGDWLHVARGPRKLADAAWRELRPAPQFMVNGPEFAFRGGTDRFMLRDRLTGLDVPSTLLDEGATIWVADGHVSGAYGGGAPDDASVAIQGWPSLVRNGEVSASNVGTNAERDTRSGIGVTRDGRVIIVAIIGTMVDLANRMVAEGAWLAAYLDGGSSSQLRAVGGIRQDSTRAAPIPAWIYAAPPASFALDARKVVGWTAAGVSAAALFYLLFEALSEPPAASSGSRRAGGMIPNSR